MVPSLVYSGLHNASIFGHKLKIWKAHHTFLESKYAEVTKNLYYALSTRRSQIPIFFHGLHRSSKFQLDFGRALTVAIHFSISERFCGKFVQGSPEYTVLIIYFIGAVVFGCTYKTIRKIFEANCSFHVELHTMGKVQFLFFKSSLVVCTMCISNKRASFPLW